MYRSIVLNTTVTVGSSHSDTGEMCKSIVLNTTVNVGSSHSDIEEMHTNMLLSEITNKVQMSDENRQCNL